ncbi:MAG: restriction endonuclease, partial [Polyangiaceae bacterium]|nr:restriction endonuclease [Polyangiaceae bacterium]
MGRPEIQAFYGALAAHRAKKGVFITTSSFTREARDFGAHVAEAVVLIDGERLTNLMMDYGVGVTHYRTIRLPRVDLDFFASLPVSSDPMAPVRTDPVVSGRRAWFAGD